MVTFKVDNSVCALKLTLRLSFHRSRATIGVALVGKSVMTD